MKDKKSKRKRERKKKREKSCEKYNTIVAMRTFYIIPLEIDEDKVEINVHTWAKMNVNEWKQNCECEKGREGERERMR